MSGSQPIGHGIATLPASQFSGPAPIIAAPARPGSSATTAAPVNSLRPAKGSARLSLAQVVTLCLARTGNVNHVADACLIAWCESGFDAHNWNDKGNTPAGSVDRGLWMLNDFWHKEVSNAKAYDPVQATGAAFHISGGFVNFSQWATRVYLPGGRSANTTRGQAAARIRANALAEAKAQLAGEKGPSPIGAAVGAIGGAFVGAGDAAAGAAGGIASAVMSVPDFLGKLADGHTWLRVLQVVGGAAAVAAGGFLLARNAVTAPLSGAAVTAAHAAAATL